MQEAPTYSRFRRRVANGGVLEDRELRGGGLLREGARLAPAMGSTDVRLSPRSSSAPTPPIPPTPPDASPPSSIRLSPPSGAMPPATKRKEGI